LSGVPYRRVAKAGAFLRSNESAAQPTQTLMQVASRHRHNPHFE